VKITTESTPIICLSNCLSSCYFHICV
jgi:hypothetical protein